LLASLQRWTFQEKVREIVDKMKMVVVGVECVLEWMKSKNTKNKKRNILQKKEKRNMVMK